MISRQRNIFKKQNSLIIGEKRPNASYSDYREIKKYFKSTLVFKYLHDIFSLIGVIGWMSIYNVLSSVIFAHAWAWHENRRVYCNANEI